MQGCHLQTNNTLFTFTSFSVISFFFLIMFFFFTTVLASTCLSALCFH